MLPAIEFKPGSVLGERYKLLQEVACGSQDQHLYLAQDLEANSQAVRVAEVGHLDLDSTRLKRRIERALQSFTWLRHPGLIAPRELFSDNGWIYCVCPEPVGQPLSDYLAQTSEMKLSQIMDWAVELTEMLGLLHEANPPCHLGLLPLQNFTVTPEGHLQLQGLVVDVKFHLHLWPLAGPLKPAPQEGFSAANDIWCLATLLRDVIAARADLPKEYSDQTELRSFLGKLSRKTAEDRQMTVSQLRGRLQALYQRPSIQETDHDLPKPMQPWEINQKTYQSQIFLVISVVLFMAAMLNLFFSP